MSMGSKVLVLALGMLLSLGGRASAERFDRLVGAVNSDGDSYLVKHFSVSRGSIVTGAAFFTNDLRTTFPRVAVFRGRTTRLADAELVAELREVRSGVTHRMVVSCPPITFASDEDVYVAIRLPASTGITALGDGPGIAARQLSGPATSYFVSGHEGTFGEMDLDYGIELLYQQVGKAAPTEAETAPIKVFLRVPSPVLASASLEFGVDRPTDVSLVVYDVSGRRVRTVVHGQLAPGKYVYPWDKRDENGSETAAGIYFARLTVGDRVLTQKLLVAR